MCFDCFVIKNWKLEIRFFSCALCANSTLLFSLHFALS